MLENLFSNPDFQLNLIAEAIGVLTETVLIYLIISRVITMRENKRWRPARVNVARRLIEVHRNLFNATRQVIDPHFHVDKKLHNVPNSLSQEATNHWGKRVFVPPLKPDLERLKKMVEYNNSALDSTLMPLVSDFLLAADEVLSATTFLLDAYDPTNQNKYSTFMPREEIMKMEEVCKCIQDLYPELSDKRNPSPFAVLCAGDLVALFEEASKINPRVDLIEKRNKAKAA